MTIDKKSLINWVGGKRLLRKTIEPLIPKDIVSYIEPFGGGGWILFYKDKWADLEIGSNLDYAAIHQLGGQAGKNKKVEIPARPYLKLTDDDFNEILDATKNFLK